MKRVSLTADMHIEWNKVTWYSKVAAVILFVLVFALGFWLGSQNAQKYYIHVPFAAHTATSTATK